MKRITLILLTIFTLAGCESRTTEVHSFILPEGLKDCKIYDMNNGLRRIIVVRCPNSSTSTQYHSGKTSVNTTVVEASL